MKPRVTTSMLALADQAESSLRDYLEDYPTFAKYLREPGPGNQVAQFMAVDVLASLSEVWETSVENRLNVCTARLLAWQRLTDSGTP